MQEKKFKAKHRGSTSSTKANITEQKLKILDTKIQRFEDIKKKLETEIEKKQKKPSVRGWVVRSCVSS